MKKKIKCPVCGNSNRSRLKSYWAMDKYKLYKCENCSMVWEAASQIDLHSQYKKSYFMNENPKGGYTNYFDGMKINRKTFSDRLGRIEGKIGSMGKLLDVGCALGDCLIEAKKSGWKETRGIEVSKYAAEYAKKRGLNVKNGYLKKNSYPKNYFDVILYQDVIEHISDPLDEVKKAKSFLKPGGLLFMVTPDVDGIWHKLLGKSWYHYKPGEHVTYFSQRSLAKLYEMAGLKKTKTRKTYHVLSLEYIFNRLKYYQPQFFSLMLKIIKFLKLQNVSFKAYTGEIESWGYK